MLGWHAGHHVLHGHHRLRRHTRHRTRRHNPSRRRGTGQGNCEVLCGFSYFDFADLYKYHLHEKRGNVILSTFYLITDIGRVT